MFTRENFTGLAWRRNALRSRTTAGTLMTSDIARISVSYSSTTSTLSRVRSVIARCQEMILIGSYPCESRSVRVASTCITAARLLLYPVIARRARRIARALGPHLRAKCRREDSNLHYMASETTDSSVGLRRRNRRRVPLEGLEPSL